MMTFQRLKNAAAKPEFPASHLLVFISENGKERVSVEPARLLYIESQDNYSAIYFLKGESISRKLIRSTLKRLEKDNKTPFLLRCHRSYLHNFEMAEAAMRKQKLCFAKSKAYH